MGDTRPCQLYVLDDTSMTLVARGTIFKATKILHGMKLSDKEIKVTVEEIFVLDTLVLMPTNEVYIVA